MTQPVRLTLLLLALAALGAFYFYDLGRRSGAPEAGVPVANAPLKPALVSETVSPTRAMLRRDDFTALDAEFARLEKLAETDADAERALKHLLTDLGHGTNDDFARLERWAGGGSHYAQLALSRAHRIRGFYVRGTAYARKVDPQRMAKFAEHNKASIDHGERALLSHPGCGLAYSQMIEALVGNSSRKQIDAMYQRAVKNAPQWYSPSQSYSFALHPKWYGHEGERSAFIEAFAKRSPGHRAVPKLQAIEYVWQADAAINDRNYGEGKILADRAIELDPGNSYGWLNKGRAFAGVQRAVEALHAMDKAVQLDPYSDSALRERAQLRLEMAEGNGQDDLVRAALLGDEWALKQSLWNWLTGRTPGVPKDWSRIPDLCERARVTGLPDGVFCVATMHYFGYGVPLDAKKGFEIMREAAGIGVADAMSDVGKIYWQGNAAAGVTPDREQAVRWWVRAADLGNNRALVELSQIKNDPQLLALVEKLRAEQPPKAAPPPSPRPAQQKDI